MTCEIRAATSSMLRNQQLRRNFAVLHEHGERIEHAEGGQRIVPGEDVGDGVVVVAEQHAGVFPAGLQVAAVFEALEEIAERVQPAAGADIRA